MKRKTSLLGLLVLLISLPVEAEESLGDAIAAWALQDFARARTIFEELAADGDVEAAYRLGVLHESGHVGDPDRDLATRWYRKASEAGHASARERLLALEDAIAGETDFARLNAAAEAGSLQAMVQLARVHASGEGAPLDLDAARHWLSEAQLRSDGVDDRVFHWTTQALAALERERRH